VWLTPWRWALLEKPPFPQLLKSFPIYYGTRTFIPAFTWILHQFLSWTRSIQSIRPHPISLRFNLILSPYLRLDLPSGLFPSGFYAFLFSPIRATCPAHLTLLDLIIDIILGWEYKLWSSPLCSFLQSPFTSSLFGPNVVRFQCVSLWYLCYLPVDSHHQHRPTADASHLLSVSLGFHEIS
jgi:hypothetical protein